MKPPKLRLDSSSPRLIALPATMTLATRMPRPAPLAQLPAQQHAKHQHHAQLPALNQLVRLALSQLVRLALSQLVLPALSQLVLPAHSQLLHPALQLVETLRLT